MASRKKIKYNYVIMVAGFACIFCFSSVFVISAISNFLFPPRISQVQDLDTPIPIEKIIELTFSASITETASVSDPIQLATLVPVEITPTPTLFIFELQTTVAEPTIYIYSTNTPFDLGTQQPTLPPQAAVCSCAGDTLNCSDFRTHSEAQKCFEYCVSQGRGDIHKLDGNNDNVACESLR